MEAWHVRIHVALPALVLALSFVLAPAVPALDAGTRTLTLPARVHGAADVAVLQPADPRVPHLAAGDPEAAEGLYAGTLRGTGDTVHLARTPDGVLGVVASSQGATWVTLEQGILVPLDPAAAPAPDPTFAGDTVSPTAAPAPAPAELSTSSPTDGTLQLLLDGDAEYHAEYEDDWDDHQLRTIHLVDAIYQASLGVEVEVVEQHVWTDASTQPLTSTQACGGGSDDLLSQFRSTWEGIRPTTSGVREAAHLFTGKELDRNLVGCAYVGVLETEYAYGVSQIGPELARGATWDLYWGTIIAAHELGHNFDGDHSRAFPNPDRSYATCAGATILFPGLCFEQPAFSGARNASLWADLGARDGGNVPFMQDHAGGRI